MLEKAGAFFDEARMSAHGTGGDGSVASAVDAPLLDDVPVCSPGILLLVSSHVCGAWPD